MGNSGSNFLLSEDGKAFNTQGLIDLNNGVGFEKVAGKGGGKDGDNICSRGSDGKLSTENCEGYKAFKDLINNMQVQGTLDLETSNFITKDTFKNEFGNFAPEVKVVDSAPMIVQEFVNQIKREFNGVKEDIKAQEEKDRNQVCKEATCLDNTDITSWLGTSKANKFKDNIKGYVLDNAFSHETSDRQEWTTKLGEKLNLQENTPVLDAILDKISTAERAGSILGAVSNNDFNTKMKTYMEAKGSAAIEGDHHLNKKLELLKNDPVPRGTIIAWKGSGKPPVGWALCDGNLANYIDEQGNPQGIQTPDLRARFIMGAIDMDGLGGSLNVEDAKSSQRCPMIKNEETGEYVCDLNPLLMASSTDTGKLPANQIGVGSATHTLTQDEMPAHKHDTRIGRHGRSFMGADAPDQPLKTRASHFEVYPSDSQGGDKPHNNLPPYYVLSYIIKL